MHNLTETSKIIANQRVAFTEIDDDVVMMGPENGLFYGVNSVGAEIWNLLQSNALSLSEICEQILQRYDVDESQCATDVKLFVEDLLNQGMLYFARS